MDFVWLLLLGMAFVYAFLLQRKQDETAIKLAKHLCKQQQLQFLNVPEANISLLNWTTDGAGLPAIRSILVVMVRAVIRPNCVYPACVI